MATNILDNDLNFCPRVYVYTEPQYQNTPWQGERQGKGLLKIGYTEKTVAERIAEQFPIKKPGEQPYSILLDEIAIRDDGTFFTDHNLRKFLAKNFNVTICLDSNGTKTEWAECTIDEVQNAIALIKQGKTDITTNLKTFPMRDEQKLAVKITADYFRKNAYRPGGESPHFLWNAKMRFGKTFTAYQLAKEMGWKKILVLTFKVAVKGEWEKELKSHVDFENWQFISDETELKFENRNPNLPCVWFASFQDMLQLDKASGGVKAKNQEAHNTNWDCIILDEYHFGAWNDSSKELYASEESAEQKYNNNDQNIFEDEDDLPLTANHFLYLSGTPFRAIATGEFLEDQIFNWTYSDEQQAKNTWDNNRGKNPYAALPQMILMTYQLPNAIRKVALNSETNEFDLNEFFRASKFGNNYKFKHEHAVQKWLDLLRGQYLAQNLDELRTRERPPMPFTDIRLRNALNHTFWFLPDVASCKAMEELMSQKANNFYQNYKIITCAGSQAGIGAEAAKRVKEKINNAINQNKNTITLSCGKLTTGVTIPAWSGIFMLRSTSSPETYFQAAFRVQSPYLVQNPDGLSPNEEIIVKPYCFVFDYAPDRALQQISQYSTKLDYKSNKKAEQLVKDFINFLPVLCFDGNSMKQLDAGEILDLTVSGTTHSMLVRRWESALLVNVDNITLQKLLNNEQALAALNNIEGFRSLNISLETIINRSNVLKKVKKEKANSDTAMTTKEKKEISDEEKQIKSNRKKIQEKLMKFATRIPIFMYLTDYREHCLKDVITQLETSLFTKVTGLSLRDFELLLEIGVFNGNLMNQAIWAFKRYEDASLSYSGVNKHENEKVGGWDTVARPEDIKFIQDRKFKTY